MNQGLIERLEAKASELSRRAIAEMYENPFWQERFGAHGRENADRDSLYHVSYLVQALAANDASIITGYARWLQTLLVSRGMSSRHISENFDRLARAIRDEIAEPQPALDLLRQASAALVYDAGVARELQRLSAPLARAVVTELERSHTSWFAAASSYPSMAAFQSVEEAERTRFEQEVLEHIGYLADALHNARLELFVQHALWTSAYLVRRRAPETRVPQALLTLRDTLARPPAGLTVSRDLTVQASLLLEAAVDALRRPSAAPEASTE